MATKKVTHTLILEVEEDQKEALRDKAKAVIKTAYSAIATRRQWIKQRQEQIVALNSIVSRTVDAFEGSDAIEIKALADEANALNNANTHGDFVRHIRRADGSTRAIPVKVSRASSNDSDDYEG